MKPRLAVPELLPEDSIAWAEVTFWATLMHFQFGSRLFAASLYADRRDAALMYTLTGGGQVLGCHAARAWVSQRLPEAYV